MLYVWCSRRKREVKRHEWTKILKTRNAMAATICFYGENDRSSCLTSAAVSFGHETLRMEKNSRMSKGWKQLQYSQLKPAVNHCICKANVIVKRNYFRGIILPLWVQDLIHAKTNHRIPELDTGVIKCTLTQHKL